jgi:hypothetical protein
LRPKREDIMAEENTTTQVVHPEHKIDVDEDIMTNNRRAFLTNVGAGSIAGLAPLLIGAVGTPTAMADSSKGGRHEGREFPDLLVLFDAQSRITLTGLATEETKSGLVTFSAMTTEDNPARLIEFQFDPKIIRQIESLAVNIPGISTINVGEAGPFKLKVDIDPMNESVASGTLIDLKTLLHVDFVVRQFELNSPFSLGRFLRRALPVLVSVLVAVATGGTVWLTTSWLDCSQRAISGCGVGQVLQWMVLVTYSSVPPFIRIDCDFTCKAS